MASRLRSLPPILIPLGVLLAACVAALALPFRMIEPDDDDYFYGMHAFARGQVVVTPEEARELPKIQLPDETRRFGQGPGAPMAMGVRSPKGFIRERSPGHYALLAFFHRFGADRLANAALALAVVVFCYFFARRQLELSAEVAVLASVLLIVNPTFLTGLYRVYMSDFDYFVWATLSLGLYFMARRTGSLWVCGAAGLSLALSVFFRNTNAISFLVIGAYEVLRYWLGLRADAALGRAAFQMPDAQCQIGREEESQDRLKAGLRTQNRSFGWRQAAVLAVAVVVGLIPLAWYGYAITGGLFGQGYQYRFERQGAAYLALWDSRAIFSLYHLGYTFSVGLPRLLQGYPLILLAPAGLLLLGRRREDGSAGASPSQDGSAGASPSQALLRAPAQRPALFLVLWLGLYWGVYLCYSTIREDSFQFMCRKLLPALAPLAVGAAVALGALPRQVRYATLAIVLLFSLGVTSEFFDRFIGGHRGGPMGPPRMGPGGVGPGGPMMRPGAELPDDLLRKAIERLGDDPRAAEQALRALIGVLRDIPSQAPLHARQATAKLLPRVIALDAELRKAAESGNALSPERQKAVREQLKALEPTVRDELAPRPEGPQGPGERVPGLLPPDGAPKGVFPPGDQPFAPRAGQKELPGFVGENPSAIVQRLHALMDEARQRGIDVSKAQELDEASKDAADRGEFAENRRLLREAVESVERALGRPGPKR